MQEASNADGIRRKFIALSGDLDERGRRRWAAVEAQALGRGGITVVSLATGIARGTIQAGLRELADPDPVPPDRQRRTGGGRKSYATIQPDLCGALDTLIEPSTRGSPTNPLRWTCKSTRRLAKELRKQGFDVSATTVRRLLQEMVTACKATARGGKGVSTPALVEVSRQCYKLPPNSIGIACFLHGPIVALSKQNYQCLFCSSYFGAVPKDGNRDSRH